MLPGAARRSLMEVIVVKPEEEAAVVLQMRAAKVRMTSIAGLKEVVNEWNV
jgi:hypothetical protein